MIIQDLKSDLAKAINRIRILEGKTSRIEIKMNEMHDTQIDHANRDMRNNLRFHGIDNEIGESWKRTRDKLYTLLSGGSRISRRGGVHPLGGAWTSDVGTFR